MVWRKKHIQKIACWPASIYGIKTVLKITAIKREKKFLTMTSASKHGKFENLEKFIFSAINVLEPPYNIPSFLHT